ncbi:MAG: hypothetical protein WC829_00990 [Hyphomicrobium sp.]|jgi:hypothetical protein
MALTFSKIRMAIDVLRGRMPGALAMLKAEDSSISIHSRGNDHWCNITFWFGRDGYSCGNAYRAMERLYEIDREQRQPPDYYRTPTARG